MWYRFYKSHFVLRLQLCEPAQNSNRANCKLQLETANCKLQTTIQKTCLISSNKGIKLIWKTFDDLPRKTVLLDFSSPSTASSIQRLEASHSKIPRKCVLKYLPRMSDHLICKIEIILHLFDLRRQTRIKFSLLKILQFISILTIFCMQYRSISPWISSALAVISCVVLGWLSWCQHQNIAFLNRTLVELCQKLPSSTIDEQSLHED